MSPFRFKKFSIDDSQCAMKIGTDGVLLGAWAFSGYFPNTILDIGAGSGLLSLMMAQRFPNASITGVEIVPEAASLASFNARQSPWNDRIEIINMDALDYTPSTKFETIISNPPFYDEAIKPVEEARKLARHGNEMNIENLIIKCSSLLADDGYLAMIAPARRTNEIIYQLSFNHLDTSRITFVAPKENTEPNRVLIEAIKGTTHKYHQNKLTIFQKDGTYSTEYKELTTPFYLDSTFK